jgi:cold shock protein
MKFKDQLLRCAACGAQFVFTISEQRQRASQGLPNDAPAFCRDCRGADVRLAEAEAERVTRVESTAAPGPGETVGDPRPDGHRRRAGGARTVSAGQVRDGRPDAARPKGPGAPRSRHGGGRDRRPAQRQTELRIRHLGTVKWFDDVRGYGFIAQDSGEELFVHSSDVLAKGVGVLVQGQSVEYEVEHTAKGLQAVDVVPLP